MSTNTDFPSTTMCQSWQVHTPLFIIQVTSEKAIHGIFRRLPGEASLVSCTVSWRWHIHLRIGKTKIFDLAAKRQHVLTWRTGLSTKTAMLPKASSLAMKGLRGGPFDSAQESCTGTILWGHTRAPSGVEARLASVLLNPTLRMKQTPGMVALPPKGRHAR